jgi:NADH-quinone oxidoreductase subunit F
LIALHDDPLSGELVEQSVYLQVSRRTRARLAAPCGGSSTVSLAGRRPALIDGAANRVVQASMADSATLSRVLDPEPVLSLQAYIDGGGGQGLSKARGLATTAIIDDIEASGLRGRGGGGFPTGRKWRTVAANRSPLLAATVVVNAAEGEPGSFKDREILRRNPYRVLEGALIAARAIRADRIVVALKASFGEEARRVRAAADELIDARWVDDVVVDVLEGPSEYLYGEETALLEVLEGRAPFPRLAPPYRHGADELGDGAISPADVDMASPAPDTLAPPTLVNNTETIANVPSILVHGPEWFRSVGTPESPGTIVCTITGSTVRDAVGEVPLGTPLRTVIDELGGGPVAGHRLVAAVSGVANPVLPATKFDTPLTYEAMAAAGTGLGAAGFIVFDDTDDLVAVAAGVSRFLAVESCGQCTPCKQDGREISEILARLGRNEPQVDDPDRLHACLDTIVEGARCYLATQHQRVVTSIVELAPEHFAAHDTAAVEPVEPVLIAPIVELSAGAATLDDRQAAKQPDWTFGDIDSGKSPADLIDQGES